ncbi:hypothetical protein BC832DRAFT_283371 [Gaertneriomyces semiglobifer]|nr:hypothetical protein BC832DRAFT_283371 [Gaertneriomyces semiglobifer]
MSQLPSPHLCVEAQLAPATNQSPEHFVAFTPFAARLNANRHHETESEEQKKLQLIIPECKPCRERCLLNCPVHFLMAELKHGLFPNLRLEIWNKRALSRFTIEDEKDPNHTCYQIRCLFKLVMILVKEDFLPMYIPFWYKICDGEFDEDLPSIFIITEEKGNQGVAFDVFKAIELFEKAM